MVRREIREMKRSRNIRPLKTNIYVSCEGDAEEAYLNGLKRRFSRVATIKISNSSPRTSAIDVVKNLKKLFKNEYDKTDLKYCAFDYDNNSKEVLREAKNIADKESFKIIFSNPCFEIWLLWHFEADFAYKNSNDALKHRIEELIRPQYWNCKNNPNLYDMTCENITNAQINSLHRNREIERYGIEWYSQESNPYTNFDDLISTLIHLEAKNIN